MAGVYLKQCISFFNDTKFDDTLDFAQFHNILNIYLAITSQIDSIEDEMEVDKVIELIMEQGMDPMKSEIMYTCLHIMSNIALMRSSDSGSVVIKQGLVRMFGNYVVEEQFHDLPLKHKSIIYTILTYSLEDLHQEDENVTESAKAILSHCMEMLGPILGNSDDISKRQEIYIAGIVELFGATLRRLSVTSNGGLDLNVIIFCGYQYFFYFF